MGRSVLRIISKLVMWTVIGLVGLVAVIVTLLYIPAVQDKIKNIAVAETAKSTGMAVEVGRLRLRFPIEVELEDVTVADAVGDTMVQAGRLYADVRFFPLLTGNVSISEAALENARYRMGARDSAMYLDAVVDNVAVEDVNLSLEDASVNVGDAVLDGGTVEIAIGNDTVAEQKTDEPGTAWLVKAGALRLKNVDYRMSMLPTIDTLSTHINDAVLADGVVDMSQYRISVGKLAVDMAEAEYRYPVKDAETADAVVTEPTDTVDAAKPWTVTADVLTLKCAEAVYAVSGAEPLPGLDMDYIGVSQVDIAVDSFYNCGTGIRVPLTRLSATERCGIKMDASGLFSMDSVAMSATGFNISTLFSTISIDAVMGMDADPVASPVSLLADARIGVPDVEMLYPSMRPLLKEIPRYNDIELKSRIDGTMADIDIHELSVSLPRYIEVAIDGNIRNVTSDDDVSGKIRMAGTVSDVDFVKPSVLEARLSRQVEIPPMRLDGDVEMSHGTVNGKIIAVTGNGRMAMDARWNGRVEDYAVTVAVDTFPVNAFLPEMGLRNITAHIDASGRGLDITSPATSARAEMSLDRVEYKDKVFENMRLWASVDSCNAEAGVISFNSDADMDIVLSGVIEKESYRWNLSGDIRNLDLAAAGLSQEPAHGSLSIAGQGYMTAVMDSIDADVTVSDLDWSMAGMSMVTSSINARINASDSLTHMTLTNNDLNAEIEAMCAVDSFIACLGAASEELTRQMTTRQVDVSLIQSELPQFYLDLTAGSDNVLNSILGSNDMSLGRLDMSVSNDSLLMMSMSADKFVSGTTKLDKIGFNAFQRSRFMVYRASVDNEPGTMDAFAHVSLNGYIADNRIGAYFRQRNIEDEVGYNLGLVLTMADSVMSVKFAPFAPVIAYKNWTVNEDNEVEYNLYTHHFDANLIMTGDDSYLKLYTEHSDSLHGQEDVILNISNLKLSEWMSVSPFAPPVKGNVSADMRFRWDERSLSGNGLVNLEDFTFGRDRVGSFLLDVDLLTDKSGVLRAETSLMIDSVKTITAVGTLNDSTAANPFNLDFSMIHFPLRIVNPFMPPGTAKLSGMLNGEMDITGELTSPVFNGYIDFDSAAVSVDMIGSTFNFSEDKVPVTDNVVTFDNYTITGVNENPLYINGNVALKNMSPDFDLTMRARNMQFMGNSRGKRIDVYGKGFINVDATVKGNMEQLNVNTTLNLLPGSNITYVMADAAAAISTQNTGDMVSFVKFSEYSDAAEDADTVASTGMALNLDAMLVVSSGTTINVDLSTDGKNRVQLQGSGSLNYTMNNMADSRVTGRYTINKGFVRYTPPLMSEKQFDFVEGSYVAFNGDMLNPILNINAIDNIRANVTREGHDSRLVNFDVSLSVTNTLSNMNVVFDLSTPDDLTIQNELQSMSAEQRANQAMNMLLYNVYTGPGTKADGNMAGNPLFAVLESRINTWAANNIKFVDISFGIDRYDSTVDGATSTTTSYSYKVSKTLFNDRFKIVVGGNYSTDAESDENFAQNLINDISFEYMLNRSGSMYVKIFRHVGYESILEGEVTQTGVGFVYKRKIHSLRDLFRRSRRYGNATLPVSGSTAGNTIKESDNGK